MHPSVDVRRAGERFRTRTDWLDSRHSFSFGPHYDPDNTHFGLLMASNDDVVRAGAGFDTHAHRDMEIVTWVLDGALVHEDSTGHSGVVRPGLAQRMSAGTGIAHAERNAAGSVRAAVAEHAAVGEAAGGSGARIGAAGSGGGARIGAGAELPDVVHLVQMWVVPDASGAPPGYAQQDVTPQLARGELVVVASGMPRHAGERAVSIGQRNAALHAARPAARAVLTLPTSPLAHVFVARGAVELEGAGTLGTGDAARITASDGRRITAGRDGAEVLVWEMHATLG